MMVVRVSYAMSVVKNTVAHVKSDTKYPVQTTYIPTLVVEQLHIPLELLPA
jgi:hypothetical protein